jgi:hypothetical protein
MFYATPWRWTLATHFSATSGWVIFTRKLLASFHPQIDTLLLTLSIGALRDAYKTTLMQSMNKTVQFFDFDSRSFTTASHFWTYFGSLIRFCSSAF